MTCESFSRAADEFRPLICHRAQRIANSREVLRETVLIAFRGGAESRNLVPLHHRNRTARQRLSPTVVVYLFFLATICMQEIINCWRAIYRRRCAQAAFSHFCFLCRLSRMAPLIDERIGIVEFAIVPSVIKAGLRLRRGTAHFKALPFASSINRLGLANSVDKLASLTP